jgi:hypothetical protein
MHPERAEFFGARAARSAADQMLLNGMALRRLGAAVEIFDQFTFQRGTFCLSCSIRARPKHIVLTSLRTHSYILTELLTSGASCTRKVS